MDHRKSARSPLLAGPASNRPIAMGNPVQRALLRICINDSSCIHDIFTDPFVQQNLAALRLRPVHGPVRIRIHAIEGPTDATTGMMQTMDGSYSSDVEFKKLLSRRSDIDLTTVALEIARDADPTLDFTRVSDWIQDRANELLGPVSRADSEREALARLGSCLYGQHGIRGQNDAYECGEGSYLHRVIETQSGIPISLSLLYMGVAEKLGIELRGVAAPSHFLTRLDSLDGPIFLDAFSEGRLLDLDECLQWFGSVTEMGRDDLDLLLRPADARSIVTRMLMNLKIVHTKHEDWNLAAKVQHRLAALMPASYTERRDLALIMARTSRTGEAIVLLRSCLKDCPDDDREVLQHCIDMTRKQHARWN